MVIHKRLRKNKMATRREGATGRFVHTTGWVQSGCRGAGSVAAPGRGPGDTNSGCFVSWAWDRPRAMAAVVPSPSCHSCGSLFSFTGCSAQPCRSWGAAGAGTILHAGLSAGPRRWVPVFPFSQAGAPTSRPEGPGAVPGDDGLSVETTARPVRCWEPPPTCFHTKPSPTPPLEKPPAATGPPRATPLTRASPPAGDKGHRVPHPLTRSGKRLCPAPFFPFSTS